MYIVTLLESTASSTFRPIEVFVGAISAISMINFSLPNADRKFSLSDFGGERSPKVIVKKVPKNRVISEKKEK